MASVDSPEEAERARDAGWRTFRIRRDASPLLPGEFQCPASEEEGKRLTCDQCRACSGNPSGLPRRGGHPAIVVHGPMQVRKLQQKILLTIGASA